MTVDAAKEIPPKTPRKVDAEGLPVVEPPREKTETKDGKRADQAPLRRLG